MDVRQDQRIYRHYVYDKALAHYGKEKQLIVALEELSEAQKEICKFLRGKGNIVNLAEEVADAYIVLEQVERMYDITEDVTINMAFKAVRLEERVQTGKG